MGPPPDDRWCGLIIADFGLKGSFDVIESEVLPNDSGVEAQAAGSAVYWITPGAVSSAMAAWKLIFSKETFVELMVSSTLYFSGVPLDKLPYSFVALIIWVCELIVYCSVGLVAVRFFRNSGASTWFAASLKATILLLAIQLVLGFFDPEFY